jgi:hypothetical protein
VHIRQIHEVKLYAFTENAELNCALLQNMQSNESLRTDFQSAYLANTRNKTSAAT